MAKQVWDQQSPLDAPFEPGAVFVPSEIRLDQDKLCWTMRRPQFRTPRGSVLEKFKRLHNQSDDAILKFATEFGVGWFCQHHLPGSHAQVPFGVQFGMEPCFPTKVDSLWFEEALQDYRNFSRAADSLITAAGVLNAGDIPNDKIFQDFIYASRPLTINLAAFPQFALASSIPRRFLLDSARLKVAEDVNTWVAMSQARPHLSWDHRRKAWIQTMRHSPWGVLGAIALALFTSVPQSQGWLICAICTGTYRPTRPPVEGRHHYCPECRNTSKMWRMLKQQQREKLREINHGEQTRERRR